MDATLRKHLLEALGISIVLTGLSYVVGLGAGWIEEISWLEVFAVFTSYMSTWLCVRERRYNYIFGAISTAAYAYLFYTFGLYASAILNLYLSPALIYGWFRWRRDEITRPVEHVKLSWVPVYLGVTALGYGGVLLITSLLDATLPVADSMILAGTILAQFLLDNKKIETWIVWAGVNVLAIYTYFTSGLTLVGFQYIFFLINTAIGFYVWNRSMHAKSLRTDDSFTPDVRASAADPIRSVVGSDDGDSINAAV